MANLRTGWTICSIEDGSEKTVLTDEFACINPKSLIDDMGRNPFISSVFVGKANSYYCPWGYPYGQAWLLVDGKTLRALKLNKRQRVRVFIEEINGETSENKRSENRELKFDFLYLQRAICVAGKSVTLNTKDNYYRTLMSPFENPYNDEDVFLLELVDIRYIYKKFTSLNQCYNLLCYPSVQVESDGSLTFAGDTPYPTASEENFYYKQTLRYASGNYKRYTRTQIIEHIHSKISSELLHGNTSLQISSARSETLGGGTSDRDVSNIEYLGWNCWDALCDYAQLTGDYVHFEPTTGELSVLSVRGIYYTPGVKDYFLEDKEIISYLHSQKLLDYRVFENPCLLFAETLKIVDVIEPVHFSNINVWEAATDDPRRTYWPNRFRVAEGQYDTEASSTSLGYNFAHFASELDSSGNPDQETELSPISGSVEKFIPPYPHKAGLFPWTDETGGSGDYYLKQENFGQLYSTSPFFDASVIRSKNYAYYLRRSSEFSGKIIYQGLAHFYTSKNTSTPTYIVPSHQTGHVIWREYGDGLGLVTETFNSSSTNLAIAPRPSAGEELGRTSPNPENPKQPVVAGFHVWPTAEASAPPQRRHDLSSRKHPETALVMVCLTYPPDTLKLGKITGSASTSGGTPGLIIYPGLSGSNMSFVQPTGNLTVTKPFGNDYGPRCWIKSYASAITQSNTSTSPGAGDYYGDGAELFAGEQGPGPMWHGRVFRGTFIGGGENGYPIFEVMAPYPILTVHLNSDITASGSDGAISGAAEIKYGGESWGNGTTTLYFPVNPLTDAKSTGGAYNSHKIVAGDYRAIVISPTVAYALSAAQVTY